MDRRRARLRLGVRLPAAGGRDLHHLHLPRRLRLRLWARRAGVLHHRLRLARLRDRLFPAAADLELRQVARAALAAGFLRAQIRQPRARRAGLGRRPGGADPLPGAAAHRPRHHRAGRGLRCNPEGRGDLGGGCDRHRLRDGLRHPRLSLDRGGEGHPDPVRGGVPRPLSADPPLRRRRRDVREDRRRQARLPGVPLDRHERRLVRLHRDC